MPIRPENKALYPRNWKAIRQQMIDRAGNQCEWCGVKNGAVGYRDKNGLFQVCDEFEADVAALVDGLKVFRVVLTVAHLDHDPTHNFPDNLKVLCCQCHNRHDAGYRGRGRMERRKEKRALGKLPLFG